MLAEIEGFRYSIDLAILFKVAWPTGLPSLDGGQTLTYHIAFLPSWLKNSS